MASKFSTDYNNSDICLDEFIKRHSDVITQAKETMEVTMDIQIVGAVANGATIDVIFAPNGSHGFYHAIYSALGLGSGLFMGFVPQIPADVISISWGMAEWLKTADQLLLMDSALQS